MSLANESRAAELTRLYDFFEKLASRGSRHTQPLSPILADPADMLPISPVVANIVNTRRGGINEGGRLEKRPRRKSTWSIDSRERDELSADEEAEVASIIESVRKFGPGKQYAFTFRHMLHKLYPREAWRKKVQEALEQSQSEYKPLAEKLEQLDKEGKGAGREVQVTHSEYHRVHREDMSVLGIGRRPRSFSVASVVNEPLVNAGAAGGRGQGEIRALKRRCVGRRKSMSGFRNMNQVSEEGRISGAWVFDGETSRFEDRSNTAGPKRRTRRDTFSGSGASDVPALVKPVDLQAAPAKSQKVIVRKRAFTTVQRTQMSRGLLL